MPDITFELRFGNNIHWIDLHQARSRATIEPVQVWDVNFFWKALLPTRLGVHWLLQEFLHYCGVKVIDCFDVSHHRISIFLAQLFCTLWHWPIMHKALLHASLLAPLGWWLELLLPFIVDYLCHLWGTSVLVPGLCAIYILSFWNLKLTVAWFI